MDNEEYLDIYQEQAAQYERLVAREDYQSNIVPALTAICDPHGRTIIDLGTGTGRLAKLLLPQAAAVFGFDNSLAMLEVGRRELGQSAGGKWGLAAAEHHNLPLAAACCDLILSGWSLCYTALDQGEGWQEGLRAILRRLRRALRPGGALIILETMGTGFSEPNPPPFMGDYFSFLTEVGMQSSWIRTDYQFASAKEAVELTRFFFGDELADQVAGDGSAIVPECTGIWWTTNPESLLLD